MQGKITLSRLGVKYQGLLWKDKTKVWYEEKRTCIVSVFRNKVHFEWCTQLIFIVELELSYRRKIFKKVLCAILGEINLKADIVFKT